VHGASLDRLPFTPDEASILDISLQLCNILTYLHNLEPPVIHRDIKPNNIILGDDGNIHLIDFGISRKYSESALKDTEKIGTEGFMPPEQYGYRQTDCRADIYSMGILLCWLLTGQRNPDELAAPITGDIITIIQKCTAFAPDNRYSTVDLVKTDLLQIK
jgi:serine/threonine protein kinase